MSNVVSWPSERSIDARAHYAVQLARGVDRTDLDPAIQRDIGIALALAAEDPCPRVRYALADAIAGSPNAPVRVIAQLAADRNDIAGLVIARSPVLDDADIPELANRLDAQLLPTLASRVRTDASAQAVLLNGDTQTAVALLLNPDVALSSQSLEAIAALHGENTRVRELLIERSDLPIAAQYAMVERLCSVLNSAGLVTNIIGNGRRRSILDDAQTASLLAAATGRSQQEIDLLVAQLIDRAELDAPAFLRVVVQGEEALLLSVLAKLAGISLRRARAVLRGGRQSVITALFERCGLDRDYASFLFEAYAIAKRVGPTMALSRAANELSADGPATASLLNALRRWDRERTIVPSVRAA